MAEQDFSKQPSSQSGANGSADELFVEAERLYDLGKLEEAIEVYRQGLQKDPDNIVAVNNLAMVYIETENFADAYEELQSAIKRGARHGELYSNLGYVLRRMGRDVEAADAYVDYLKTCDDSDEAEKIQSWIDKVRLENPEPAAPAASTSDGLSVEALLELADQAYEREAYEEAKTRYDQVLNVDLQNAEALSGRGQSLAKLGLMEESLASLREAVSIQPDDAPTWYVLGFVLRSLNRNIEAADAFEQFVSRMPDVENAEKIREWISQIRAEQSKQPAAVAAHPDLDQPTIVVSPAEPDSVSLNFDDEEILLEKTSMALSTPKSQQAPVQQQPQIPQAEQPVQPESEAAPEWTQTAHEPQQVSPAEAEDEEFSFDFSDIVPNNQISMPADNSVTPDPTLEKTMPDVPLFQGSPEEASAGMISALDAAFGPDDQEPDSLSFDPPAASEDSTVAPETLTVSQRLEQAYSVMATGDSSGAYEIARGICSESPNHFEALLLAARCLGQLRRFQEAAGYLKTLLESEENDEALYLYARCEEELGDPESAMELFRRCAECTADTDLKESALAHVHDLSPVAVNVLCPACGKRVAEEKLAQNDNGETMCEDCLRQYENRQKMVANQPRFQQKKKKRGYRCCCLGLVAIFVLVPAMIAGAFYLFPALIFQPIVDALMSDPQIREQISDKIKDSSEEEIEQFEKQLNDIGIKIDLLGLYDGTWGQTSDQKKNAKNTKIEYKVLAEQVVFFIPGVPNSTSFTIDPVPPENSKLKINVDYSRQPNSPITFDEESRTLSWQPGVEDITAGEVLITCQATIGRMEATAATIAFRIMTLPDIKPLLVQIPPVPFDPGDATLIATGILDRPNENQIIVANGRNLFGQLLCYGNTTNGWKELASLNLDRRPIGLSVFDDKTVILVDTRAIYQYQWNPTQSRFVQKSEPLEFPANAALCAFGNPDGEGGPGLAVLIPSLKQILVYESVGNDDLVQYHRLPIPELTTVWKQMQIADLVLDDNQAEEIMLWSGGQKMPNLYVRNLLNGAKWKKHSPGTGALLCAGWRPVSKTEGELAAVMGAGNPMMQFIPAAKPGQRVNQTPIAIENGEMPVGFAFADLDGNGLKDLAVLLPDRIMLRFWTNPTTSAQAPTISLHLGAAPFLGKTAVMKLADGRESIVMVHRDGSISTLQMPQLPQTAEETK